MANARSQLQAELKQVREGAAARAAGVAEEVQLPPLRAITHSTAWDSKVESPVPRGRAARSAGAEPPPSAETRAQRSAIVALIKEHNIPLDVVRSLKRDFAVLDTKGEGRIPMEAFEEYVQREYSLTHDEVTGTCRKSQAMVDFPFVLEWYGRNMFSEQLTVPTAEERDFRRFARDMGVELLDLDEVRRLFKSFDTDGTGDLDREEFTQAIISIYNIRNRADVSATRFQRMWREADLNFNGVIDFKEFFTWYVSQFAGADQ